MEILLSVGQNTTLSIQSRRTAFSSNLSSSLHVHKFRCPALTNCSSSHLAHNADQFIEASKYGNVIPLYRCIDSSCLTPGLIYRNLTKEDERDAPSFLFEPAEPIPRSDIWRRRYLRCRGRYSVIGAQPTMEIVAKENMVTIIDHEKGSKREEIVEDPTTVPQRIMENWKPKLLDELPETFCGGWFGYFSYDTVRYIEKKKLPFSASPVDDRNLPDVHLGLYEDVIVFDNLAKDAYVIHWIRIDQYSSPEEALSDGITRLQALVSRVQAIGLVSPVHEMDMPRLPTGSMKFPELEMSKSNMTREEYKEIVRQAKEHIMAGDIFQILLSQRFERHTCVDPYKVYRALNHVHPSPYMTYLQARESILVASSPEILTRVKKGKITNCPLAGTVRMGRSLKEDSKMEKQLLKNEKLCAEHIMLVDLGRNDLGKVSKFGSVKVERLMDIERYSHVMHNSSMVTGELLNHLTSWDALRAALPVGMVSGAPKVKAMQLIDKFESTRRGPYSGGFGGISFNGDMDIALVLGTMVFPMNPPMYSYKDANKRRQWVAHLQAGARIVADSDPDDEHKECENKAAALAHAIDVAEFMFGDK